ncbi:MAG: Asp-tRNA(Asn)/Glu-tRNA(Gln) amidotransferase subunit GatC [Candidatus Methanosuratincola sp.]|jgi:aspartyl-tRNA(Asn)/glutamyl-tRNA(Gln) amidotransferase subunit C|nr:Asp-tRNA(Asn)/Glu-tRNA(Gln) amidotransferase subunit GatC [Candidatus Methanosuratincola sp.]
MESIRTVSKERTERLAWLSKIALTREEVEKFTDQLNRILEFAKALDSPEVEGAEPTFHVLDLANTFREDLEEGGLKREEALSTAPKVKDGFIVAPKIV